MFLPMAMHWIILPLFESKPLINNEVLNCPLSARLVVLIYPGVELVTGELFNLQSTLRRSPVASQLNRATLCSGTFTDVGV